MPRRTFGKGGAGEYADLRQHLKMIVTSKSPTGSRGAFAVHHVRHAPSEHLSRLYGPGAALHPYSSPFPTRQIFGENYGDPCSRGTAPESPFTSPCSSVSFTNWASRPNVDEPPRYHTLCSRSRHLSLPKPWATTTPAQPGSPPKQDHLGVAMQRGPMTSRHTQQ